MCGRCLQKRSEHRQYIAGQKMLFFDDPYQNDMYCRLGLWGLAEDFSKKTRRFPLRGAAGGGVDARGMVWKVSF